MYCLTSSTNCNCLVRQKQLKLFSLLNVNVYSIHRCETCGKEFIQPSNYSRHLRIHTKERPYACNLCSAQFPYSTSLKRHQQRDHGVNLLSCRVCSKTFLNETSLVRHRTGCELRACVTTTGAELCAQLLWSLFRLLYSIQPFKQSFSAVDLFFVTSRSNDKIMPNLAQPNTWIPKLWPDRNKK